MEEADKDSYFALVMSPDAIARRYRAHCTREGLPYVPPMYLRHTYVYLAIGAGVPEAVIKEQLGHTESSSMAFASPS